MEALAARGHTVRVVSRIEKFGEEHEQRFREQLAARGVSTTVNGAVRFQLSGVDVRTLTGNPHFAAYFSKQLEEFDPDVILTSTDDPAQLLFEIAVRASRARVVHLRARDDCGSVRARQFHARAPRERRCCGRLTRS